MKIHMVPRRRNAWFERIYKVGVGIKGFDGLVELIAGVLLLAAPQFVHALLVEIVHKSAAHHEQTYQFIAHYVARFDVDMVKSGLVFLVVFLISHGIIKIVLVYCLFKEIRWAYPYALIILGGFFVYQAYVLAVSPSIGIGILTVFDAIIIYLVWGEWRELSAKK